MLDIIIYEISKEHLRFLTTALGKHTRQYVLTHKELPPKVAVVTGNNYYFITNTHYKLIAEETIDGLFLGGSIHISLPYLGIVKVPYNQVLSNELLLPLEDILNEYKNIFKDGLFQAFPMSLERESEILELGPRLKKTHDDYDVIISKYGTIIVYPFLANYMKK